MQLQLTSAYQSFARSDMALAVGLRVLDIAQENTKVQGSDLVRMLEQSVQPHLGQSIDMRV